MFGKQTVAIVRTGSGARAVWLRGSPGSYELVRAISVDGSAEEAFSSLLQKMRAEKVPLSGLVLGVPGSAATLRYHKLPPVPDWRLQLILKYETEEMAEKSGEPLSSDSLPLEIPESAGDDEVHLLGMGKEHELVPMLSEIESVGGRIRRAIPCALGVAHTYLGTQTEAEETVLLAEIGEAESHLAIVREGRLLFARTVTFGTGELDDLLCRRLDLSMDDAKKVRGRAAVGKLPDELASGVESTLRTWAGQLGQLVSSSVSFCRAQTNIRDLTPDRLLLAGEGAALALKTEITADGMPDRIEPLIPKISGESLPGNPEEWAPIVGLAAAGVDPRERILDLLPAAFAKKREFRERTRFLYGAAAALILAVVVQGVAGSMEHGRADAVKSEVSKWQKNIKSWKDAERQAEAANERYTQRRDRLKEEVLTGKFHVEVLDELARSIPDAISLSEVRSKRVEGETGIGVELEISGYSDNSDGKGIDHMETLRDHFLNKPGVRRSEITPGDLEDGSYPFVLTVSPDDTMPEARKRGGSSRGGSPRGPGRRGF